MNKKGSIFLGLALGIFLFISGIMIMPFIADDVSTTRVDLDCTNSSISDGHKLSCSVTDATIPYFIWLVASLSIGLIIGGLK